jgi:hypothetical protein
MPEIKGIEKLFSVTPKKRFGLFNQFGTSQFGFSNYGEEDIYFIRAPYGVATFGDSLFGDVILLSGIYRTDNVTGKTKFYRQPYYITKNPRYAAQQANRQKYADGVLVWQGLTDAQKLIYNIKAEGKRMSGYNLFLKKYLLSH